MIENIEVFTGENENGGESFTFTEVGNLHHEHVVVGRYITQAIFLKTGAITYTAKLKQGSIRFKANKATKLKDDYKNYTLSFFVPKDDAPKRESFDEMMNRRWMIIYKDNNGNRTVLGDKGRGCIFVYDFEHGNESKANGYKCSFSYASANALPIIKEAVSEETTVKTDEQAQNDFSPFG